MGREGNRGMGENPRASVGWVRGRAASDAVPSEGRNSGAHAGGQGVGGRRLECVPGFCVPGDGSADFLEWDHEARHVYDHFFGWRGE